MRILIVDDSTPQRIALAALLRSAGYPDLTQADSARTAFKLLGLDGTAGEPIDLILMDFSMPEIDGISACQRIRASETLRDIPIIMVTSKTEAEDLALAFEAGANDYITKPPNKIELLARVRSALRLKQETDERKARERDLMALTEELNTEQARSDQLLLDLQAEQQRSERLLLNVLPGSIAERLKHNHGVIVDSYEDATVLFADIVNFTALSEQLTPERLVALLNELFSLFDELVEQHGLEKIKTIGDAYMAASGLPERRPDHAEQAIALAQAMCAAFRNWTTQHALPINLRIGLHAGPVIAGVIGTKKFIYDLWGDTVNIASRMESHGLPGQIQVSDVLYRRLRHRYDFRERGEVAVKGKGTMQTYLLVSPQR